MRTIPTIALLAVSGPAVADLHAGVKEIHCGCDPGQTSCSCPGVDYTLGKSATTEFRAYCDVTSRYYPDITVSAKDSGATCTIQIGAPVGVYRSKSCTNRDPFSTDHLSIVVKCYGGT